MPFRVGELMFDDRSFAPLKGKTDELFSALFHRRFADPEHAFSETTAYPADRLSAANLAAKLVISTLADVGHTMFMSGLTPFPVGHWAVLGPAMRQQTRLHAEVAGHRPRGPFKHHWGEAQRLVGDDQPFSLWLAIGVPFEVGENLPSDGWTFLSDFDARELASRASGARSRLICRPSATTRPLGAEVLGESPPELFAFKSRIREELREVPHVEEDQPATRLWRTGGVRLGSRRSLRFLGRSLWREFSNCGDPGLIVRAPGNRDRKAWLPFRLLSTREIVALEFLQKTAVRSGHEDLTR